MLGWEIGMAVAVDTRNSARVSMMWCLRSLRNRRTRRTLRAGGKEVSFPTCVGRVVSREMSAQVNGQDSIALCCFGIHMYLHRD